MCVDALLFVSCLAAEFAQPYHWRFFGLPLLVRLLAARLRFFPVFSFMIVSRRFSLGVITPPRASSEKPSGLKGSSPSSGPKLFPVSAYGSN